MELVEGQTLAQQQPSDGFTLSRLLEIAIPLADAVSCAHQAGITHRDLKPDNIMIDAEGRLRVLDFGLAKLHDLAERADSTLAPTVTSEGRVLGTAAYMAPEQAEGKPVDARSDIFSLGIILYEMACGARPFQGDTNMSTIGSILKDEPTSVTELNQSLPNQFGRIVRRCLVKDPNRRYQSAIELRNELEEFRRELSTGELEYPAALRPGARRTRGWAFGLGALVVAVLAYLLWSALRPGPPAEAVRVAVHRLTSSSGSELFPKLSADGASFLYVVHDGADRDIFFRRVAGGRSVNLTEDSPADDSQPAFAPDGDRIAFRSERDGGGIFLMGAMGESVKRLTNVGFNPAWSPDGRSIVVATESIEQARSRSPKSQLWTIPVDTAERRLLATDDAVQPAWSPHGSRIAYWGLLSGSGNREIWTVAAEGDEPVQVTRNEAIDWSPVWSPSGKHLYFLSDRSGTMNVWRVAIDEETGRVLASPQPVTAGSSGEIRMLDAARSVERMVYSQGFEELNIERVELDPEAEKALGEPIPVTSGGIQWISMNISPDGEWLVSQVTTPQEDLYVARVDGSGIRPLTDDEFKDRAPRWSPDGERIAFYSDRMGSYEIFTIRPDGSDLRQLTDTPGLSMNDPEWFPDGTRILVAVMGEQARIIDANLPASEQEPKELPSPDAGTRLALFDVSPDGRRVAADVVALDGSRRGTFLVDLGTRTGRRVVEDGGAAAWLHDGRRLLFLRRNSVHLLDTETGRTHPVFELDRATPIVNFSLAPDDRFIYFNRLRGEFDIWMIELE
jgi:Tol biopolymer transport system component